ncbi:PepSY domain-containing protein [Paraburkholderia rhizosphaerae]|uniref:NADPH--hemoprotein reductase n=1 Tax=Paraburkholderia rhizosphaerae TaxID=480658 RepID=A0A4R8LPJ7_9BURK|nr:PepSY domain-containing protein [Paraburkholderia rhizosphaerae]TDY48237.1 sulfite reductase (NADPH) flavoprotein alpha-component [Paraburkholderia rhizosphaerae]
MLRKLHSLPGLIAAIVLTIMALSGAVLSVKPAVERAGTTRLAQGTLDVATLAARVKAQHPVLEKIVRKPSGEVIAYYNSDGESRASRIDPSTGAAIGLYAPSPAMHWVTNLHRKFLLGNAGRIAAGVAAGFMLLLGASGLALLARRMGGWRHLPDRVRGSGLQRVHNEIARVALIGLMLSATTGLIMSLTTFRIIPERHAAEPAYPDYVSRLAPLPVGQLAALKGVDVTALRELAFPAPQNPRDVYALSTSKGAGYVDPSSGTWLAWQDNDALQRVHETVFMLHTGEGLWWLALLLGAASASVPMLAVSGIWLWARRRRAMPVLANNVRTRQADTVILVGSESNATWGFATAIHQALTRANLRVHTASMNDLSSRYGKAQRLIILTSTFGDANAPSNATQFLHKLAGMDVPPPMGFAVLGFGDRQYPNFCGYAHKVHEALCAKGMRPLMDLGRIDRQSESAFRKWVEQLSTALDVALEVRYQPSSPRTIALRLIERKDYGAGAEAFTSVLRFVRSPKTDSAWQRLLSARLPAFEAGDLAGIVPPGDTVPRFYSLASDSQDGFVEICVRRHPDGLCSGYLTSLKQGDSIDAFIRTNAGFRPAAGAAPLILVGAGTGIGPFVGFIRQNAAGRPVHLYFGARRSGDSFLYDEELRRLVGMGRLTVLTTALSSPAEKTYVQERLLADAVALRKLVARGAHVMVCGGRDMAREVANAWERILAGSGLTVNDLKLRGSYVEDVY